MPDLYSLPCHMLLLLVFAVLLPWSGGGGDSEGGDVSEGDGGSVDVVVASCHPRHVLLLSQIVT